MHRAIDKLVADDGHYHQTVHSPSRDAMAVRNRTNPTEFRGREGLQQGSWFTKGRGKSFIGSPGVVMGTASMGVGMLTPSIQNRKGNQKEENEQKTLKRCACNCVNRGSKCRNFVRCGPPHRHGSPHLHPHKHASTGFSHLGALGGVVDSCARIIGRADQFGGAGAIASVAD